MRRKKIKWKFGDIFGAKLPNGELGLLQVIDLFMTNFLYVAITDKKVNALDENLSVVNSADIISLVALSRHELDFAEGFILLGSQGINCIEK
ncbi:MAG: hypothetical protein IPP48_06240 [Chitinophagaceae bacterium]|nr:hypothetical protein [Chitinophagaceae bacterium]